MTTTVFAANNRGHADFGWLDSHHSFSFGEYDNPARMGFGVLRVLNEDRVQGGGGFPPHPHRDMEIISYVLEGGLAHRDSSGGEGVIRPNDLQVMTAGTGVTHSEFNASASEAVHFLQIWLLPKAKGLAPRYAQHSFTPVTGWQLLASPGGEAGSLPLHANAKVWRAKIQVGEALPPLPTPQSAWVQVARGDFTLNGLPMHTGDGAEVQGGEVTMVAGSAAEVVVIEMV